MVAQMANVAFTNQKMNLRQNLLPQQLEQLYKFKRREQICKKLFHIIYISLKYE